MQSEGTDEVTDKLVIEWTVFSLYEDASGEAHTSRLSHFVIETYCPYHDECVLDLVQDLGDHRRRSGVLKQNK